MKKRIKKPVKTDNSETDCSNCGTPVSGRYCSSCGQKHSDLHKPLSELTDDLLDTLNLDKKILRTIVPFIVKPGFLASEYLDGRRQRYTSPLRLYLLMSLLFFFLAQATSNSDRLTSSTGNFTFSNDSTDRVVIDDSLAIQLLKNDSILLAENDTLSDDIQKRRNERSRRFTEAAIKATSDKGLFLRSLYKNISYILFVLMPAFALLLKLLYIRRKRFYIEHLIFSLNMHSFALLIFSVIIILKLIFPAVADGFNLAFLLLPVYFTSGMKRFYNQGIFKTLIKELLLALLYAILLIISIIGVLVLTLYLL